MRQLIFFEKIGTYVQHLITLAIHRIPARKSERIIENTKLDRLDVHLS